jgi:hypothetical protein
MGAMMLTKAQQDLCERLEAPLYTADDYMAMQEAANEIRYLAARESTSPITGFSEPDADHEFKNFHRALCERFEYVHDEKDWKRDQLSLIEHIAAKQSAEVVTLTASQREKLEQLADVRFTRPLDGWDKHVLRKLLERTSARNEPGRTLTEEQFEELEEARDILENMLSSIEADGNYSTAATCTFLRQALLCLRPVVMRLSRIDAAPPSLATDARQTPPTESTGEPT